jgi:hypothetical protein
MGRKPRVEIEGGLYHVITRGNNRQAIFHCDDDYQKFLSRAKRKLARERYREFVAAGMKLGHREEFYLAEEGWILGTEEFVDKTIHRIGETRRVPRATLV